MFALLAPSPSTLYRTFLNFLTTFTLSTGEPSTTEQATTSTPPTAQGPPPAILIPKIHPLEPQVTAEVEAYFIEHWPFPNGKAIQKFRDAGFSYVTCCYYPEALPDRIHIGCRLLTLLFLIDGMTPPSVFAELNRSPSHRHPRAHVFRFRQGVQRNTHADCPWHRPP